MASSAFTERVLSNQLRTITKNQQEVSADEWIKVYGYYVVPHPDKQDTWYALLVGPDQSTHSGGFLVLRITFPKNYPMNPPVIENMCRIMSKMSENCWSADQKQQLMGPDGKYQDYYGLVCTTSLNVPHSKVVTNAYGEMHEVYDKSKEQYSPALNIASILVALRSLIMTEESKLAHLDETTLRHLVTVNLVIGVGLSILKPDTPDFHEFIIYRPDEREVVAKFRDKVAYAVGRNRAVYENLLSSPDIMARLTEVEKRHLRLLIASETQVS